MLFPVDTSLFAAIFALIYAGMTLWVIVSRTKAGTMEGSGGHPELEKRIRVHGNFGEYVPLALILIGLLEGGGGNHTLVLVLCWLLLMGRILHPIGLFATPNTPQMYIGRGGGMLATVTAIVVAAIALLVSHA